MGLVNQDCPKPKAIWKQTNQCRRAVLVVCMPHKTLLLYWIQKAPLRILEEPRHRNGIQEGKSQELRATYKYFGPGPMQISSSRQLSWWVWNTLTLGIHSFPLPPEVGLHVVALLLSKLRFCLSPCRIMVPVPHLLPLKWHLDAVARENDAYCHHSLSLHSPISSFKSFLNRCQVRCHSGNSNK